MILLYDLLNDYRETSRFHVERPNIGPQPPPPQFRKSGGVRISKFKGMVDPLLVLWPTPT